MDASVSRSDGTGTYTDGLSLDTITEPCLTVPPDAPALAVLDRFLKDRELRVLPVVDNGRPVGLVNRSTTVEMFSRPFHRDLFGRRPIRDFMDRAPIIVDVETDIDDLAQKLVSVGLQQMLDGFVVIDRTGRYAGIGNAQNLLSEVTKRKQAHLHQLAHFDALTGLPNRILFRDRLLQALAQAARNRQQLAVVFLDLDHFKRINDTLGHPAGDALLQVVARRLAQNIRQSDTLARMGGDEFTLVLNNLTNASDAAVVVRKLRASLKEPIVLEGQPTVVNASIGIALYPNDGTDMDELVRKADIALYASKHAGRNNYHYFDTTHEVFDDSRLYLENELRTAIGTPAIYPVFQALVDARTRRVVGVEALARWRHPDKGLIAPATFVPLAEDTGLIKSLDREIARAAITTHSAAPALHELLLSLNVSAVELRDPRYAESFLDRLAAWQMPADRVQLEITERLLLEPDAALLARLEALRTAGVRIAIDDFGVGSTSLRQLHRLPVDVLKIDRGFVNGADGDDRVAALVRAIVDMGHALELTIVAEGVETPRQAERLAEAGCDLMQGYLFCRPVEAAEFVAWLTDGPSLTF